MSDILEVRLDRKDGTYLDLNVDKHQISGSMLGSISGATIFHLFLGQQMLSIKAEDEKEVEYLIGIHKTIRDFLSPSESK